MKVKPSPVDEEKEVRPWERRRAGRLGHARYRCMAGCTEAPQLSKDVAGHRGCSGG